MATLLYEGKAKRIFKTDDTGVLLVEFKDDASAFDGKKKGVIRKKGELNATISAVLFGYLQKNGIPNHFIEQISPHRMLVKSLTMLPLEAVVRNKVAGSLKQRIGLAEGQPLNPPVLELYYKDDDLGDPLINEYHIQTMGWARPEEVDRIRDLSFKVNTLLINYFKERGIELVDFKLEFGRYGRDIVLGDEISPDTCRFWDKQTGRSLDKDRFRRDMGEVEAAYAEVLKRIRGEEA